MVPLRSILVCIAALACVNMAMASALHLPYAVEQTDPITGLHWQRVLDPKHPAAPPRLIPLRSSGPALADSSKPLRPALCVRAGGHVFLRSAHAGVSTLSLEGTALQSGVCGARVRARVAVTGALVEITVLNAGVGILSSKAGAWR